MQYSLAMLSRWIWFVGALEICGCRSTTLLPNNSDSGFVPDGGFVPDAGFVAATSVLQHHLNPSRDGQYVEAAFTRSAASGLRRDPNFNAVISGEVYGQPLYLDGSPGGRDRLIVASEANIVYVLDATTGSVIVQRT